jgi:hypothetical protein
MGKVVGGTWRDQGASSRRRSEISAYVGPNGSGKSLAMVHDTIPSLQAGRMVLSTVKLLDPVTKEAHPSYVRLTDWTQLLEAEHCDVLFDEVIGIASSRSSQGMPQQVSNLLNQLRRRDIVLRWTAPAWGRADVIIRECTKSVTVARGFMSKTPVQIPGEPDVRGWRPKRLFRWVTYPADDFSTWTDTKTSKLSPSNTAWHWGPSGMAFQSYDTHDAVERVGEVLDSGNCAHCGGSRPRKKCECDDHKPSLVSVAKQGVYVGLHGDDNEGTGGDGVGDLRPAPRVRPAVGEPAAGRSRAPGPAQRADGVGPRRRDNRSRDGIDCAGDEGHRAALAGEIAG